MFLCGISDNSYYVTNWQQAEITHMETKSIEQLEKDIWENQHCGIDKRTDKTSDFSKNRN